MKKLFEIAALALAMGIAAHAEDNWQKTKDCAAIARQWQQDQEKKESPGSGIRTEAHYDPRSDQCYVKATFIGFPLDGYRFTMG